MPSTITNFGPVSQLLSFEKVFITAIYMVKKPRPDCHVFLKLKLTNNLKEYKDFLWEDIEKILAVRFHTN